MKALVYQRSPLRYAVANVLSRFGRSSPTVGPVQLRDTKEPKLPSHNWVRVRPTLSGICGSDLASVAGRTSGYFEQVTSFPFVLGHEVTGRLENDQRVVLEPVLGCEAREIEPRCSSCVEGIPGTCHCINSGVVSTGLQIGFCKSTGGGWSESLVAHQSQIHELPDDVSDEEGVLVEPVACAVHAVAQRSQTAGANVVVLGAGTIGLAITAALKAFGAPRSVTVAAKHKHQQSWATQLGADTVVSPRDVLRIVRSQTGTMLLPKALMSGERLTGGADVVFDCVGNSTSLAQAASIVRPRGRIVLMGLPASVNMDMAPLWQREVELASAYCYSRTNTGSDFAQAMELVKSASLGNLVSARYPLSQSRAALEHAAHAGARGATKIVFDLSKSA